MVELEDHYYSLNTINDIYSWNTKFLYVETTTVPANSTAKISKDLELGKGNWLILSTRSIIMETVNGNGSFNVNNYTVSRSANGYAFFDVINISTSATANVYLRNWSGAAINISQGDTQYKYWIISKL